MARNKKFSKNENLIFDGLIIDINSSNKKESRVYTLLLKGLITYFVTAGSIGCAFTATRSQLNQVVFNIVVLILSFIVSLFYYSKTTEYIFDVLYLIFILIFGVSFGTYINSGFYSWMNDIIGAASVYFDLPDIGGYTEQVRNSHMALTFAATYLGAVAVILVMMSIVKKMRYFDLIIDISVILFLPVYLELESSYLYIVYCFIGLVLSYVWSVGGFNNKVDNNNQYFRTPKRNIIKNAYNVKSLICIFLQSFVFLASLFLLLFVLYPKESYILSRTKSELKNTSDDSVQSVITSGITGFFNKYDSVGGMSSGRLGGINSVRLDYNTDINVIYAPYSYDPIYLRSFVGGNYIPYTNMWTVSKRDMLNDYEFQSLRQDYFDEFPYSSVGLMFVNNVAASKGEYIPYYSESRERYGAGTTVQMRYYPRVNLSNKANPDFIKMDSEAYEYWTEIPDDNISSIDNAINYMELSKDDSPQDTAKKIKEYYLKNVPYTLRPGQTPRKKDFINYFLDNNKKGYCVHFASAATLIFRRLGIPARYVEGYAFDYMSVMESTVLNDRRYESFYNGYSELGDTGVVSVDLSDADAHAWVEIYTKEYGWIPVELTPPSSDVDTNGFMDRFMSIFRTKSNEVSEVTQTDEREVEFNFSRIRLFIICIFVIGILYLISRYIYIKISFQIKYNNASLNDKLIMKYHIWLNKYGKKYEILRYKLNYYDQIIYMFENIKSDEEKQKIINILNKAGFSNETVTQEEFDYLDNILKVKINDKK